MFLLVLSLFHLVLISLLSRHISHIKHRIHFGVVIFVTICFLLHHATVCQTIPGVIHPVNFAQNSFLKSLTCLESLPKKIFIDNFRFFAKIQFSVRKQDIF